MKIEQDSRELIELIDFSKIDGLLEGFNKVTGFVTAILDLEGNVLSKSGWRTICTEFHRIHPETSKLCTVSDTILAGKMKEGVEYHFYNCMNGLVDVAVPLVIEGEHIGNLFTGQFFFKEPDREFFRKQAEKYSFHNGYYLTALEEVPIVDKDEVEHAMAFLLSMTQVISEMILQQVRLRENSEKLEEMVEVRTKELTIAQEQLIRKEKLASLGQLAGGVGHELRNPLGVISNAVYYLNTITSPDKTAKDYLDIISMEIKTATRIISELLDFGKVRTVNRETVVFYDLVNQVIDKKTLPSTVNLMVDIDQKLPAMSADPGHMEQVITNLVSNACHAMPDGGNLSIVAKSNQNSITIAVADNGKGIEKENINKIFEPLFTTRTKGIGLGLALTKNMVEANGGSISVDSKLDSGTTFTLKFPQE